MAANRARPRAPGGPCGEADDALRLGRRKASGPDRLEPRRDGASAFLAPRAPVGHGTSVGAWRRANTSRGTRRTRVAPNSPPTPAACSRATATASGSAASTTPPPAAGRTSWCARLVPRAASTGRTSSPASRGKRAMLARTGRAARRAGNSAWPVRSGGARGGRRGWLFVLSVRLRGRAEPGLAPAAAAGRGLPNARQLARAPVVPGNPAPQPPGCGSFPPSAPRPPAGRGRVQTTRTGAGRASQCRSSRSSSERGVPTRRNSSSRSRSGGHSASGRYPGGGWRAPNPAACGARPAQACRATSGRCRCPGSYPPRGRARASLVGEPEHDLLSPCEQPSREALGPVHHRRPGPASLLLRLLYFWQSSRTRKLGVGVV